MLADLLKQPLPFCIPLEQRDTEVNVTMLGHSPWDHIGSFLFTMPHHSTFFADIPCSASLALHCTISKLSNVWRNYSSWTKIHYFPVRVLPLRSGVIHGFCDRALTLSSCECAASSVLVPCALSSACLVSCWSMVFGSRHSCLEFWFVSGLDTRALCSVLLCERAVSSSLGRALPCPCVLWCASSSCFYQLRAFMLCQQLVYLFHWLRAFMLSCLVCTRSLCVSH